MKWLKGLRIALLGWCVFWVTVVVRELVGHVLRPSNWPEVSFNDEDMTMVAVGLAALVVVHAVIKTDWSDKG
jgi:hypothetical protein